MTKTEARKWARKSRTDYGCYAISARETEFPCALAVAKGPRDRMAHRVTVHHMPWEAGRLTAGMIDKVMLEHYLSEDPEDRCPYA